MKQRQFKDRRVEKTAVMKRVKAIFIVIPMMVLMFAGSVFASGPVLDMNGLTISASTGAVTVPVQFTSNGNKISTIMFSIDYDENLLSLNKNDADNDGIPDAVNFSIPRAFQGSVSLDINDTDGELDIIIADVLPPLSSMPDGVIVTITFQAKKTISQGAATVKFSSDPAPSFGSTTGQSVQN